MDTELLFRKFKKLNELIDTAQIGYANSTSPSQRRVFQMELTRLYDMRSSVISNIVKSQDASCVKEIMNELSLRCKTIEKGM